jgi:drug/metabolite transporter (DMT)-like permease
MIPDRRRGIAWALGSANEVGEPSTSAFALLAWAALFNSLLGIYQLRGRRPIPLTPYEGWIALALAVLSLLGNLASASGIAILSPSLFNVLQRSEVLVVPLLAWALIGERVERRFWLGAAIAAAGLLVMNDPFGSASVDPRGALFALAAVLCFSVMGVVTRMAIFRVDPVRLNAMRLWMTLPLWWVVTGGAVDLGSIGAAQLGYTALAAFAGPFAARLCLIFSARHVDARITALGALGAPAVSVPFEWLLLAHVPPRQQLFGGAILLAGIAVPLLRRRAR